MKMGILYICLGVVFLTLGIKKLAFTKEHESEKSVSFSSKKSDSSQIESGNKIEIHESFTEQLKSEPAVEKVEQPFIKKEEMSAKDKGNEFESYVADLCKSGGVRVREWHQGTVSPGGVLAENALNPDFFLSIPRSGSSDIEFWLECKYRSHLGDEFSLKESQVNRYKEKQRSSKRKVLVALGIGGKPSKPHDLYVFPVDSMENAAISSADLSGHKVYHHPNLGAIVEAWFRNEVFKKANKKK